MVQGNLRTVRFHDCIDIRGDMFFSSIRAIHIFFAKNSDIFTFLKVGYEPRFIRLVNRHEHHMLISLHDQIFVADRKKLSTRKFFTAGRWGTSP